MELQVYSYEVLMNQTISSRIVSSFAAAMEIVVVSELISGSLIFETIWPEKMWIIMKTAGRMPQVIWGNETNVHDEYQYSMQNK